MFLMMVIVSHAPNLPLIGEKHRSETGLYQPDLAAMTADSPTLADDEESLAAYGSALGDAFERIAVAWFVRLVEERSPGATACDEVANQLEAAAQDTVAGLRVLLAADTTRQQVGPLEVLRRSVVGVPTQMLKGVQAPLAIRDDFAQSNFPDDVYGLTPASFGDVDPSLHEPGLVWGAAKAHVHLRRRRDAARE
jgi:hypothetical protein